MEEEDTIEISRRRVRRLFKVVGVLGLLMTGSFLTLYVTTGDIKFFALSVPVGLVSTICDIWGE